jgi:hypothetical protein
MSTQSDQYPPEWAPPHIKQARRAEEDFRLSVESFVAGLTKGLPRLQLTRGV